jgi:hypothetical protein
VVSGRPEARQRARSTPRNAREPEIGCELSPVATTQPRAVNRFQ